MAIVRLVDKRTGEEILDGDMIDVESGESQAIAAARLGNVGDLKLLHERHANFNYQDPDGWTALMTACATHHVDCALYLISCNANLELAAKDGWTALMIAIDHNQEEIVKSLLDAGAKTGRFNYSGACELCIAAKYPRLAELLLEHGANPNQPHPKLPLVTPLFLTLSHCKDAHPDFVRALVKHGAEINAQTKEGQTPLMVSVMNADITKVLLECGADPLLQDQDGETALDYAQKPGVDPMAYEILNKAMQKQDKDIERKDDTAIDEKVSLAEAEKNGTNGSIFTSETNCTINIDDIKSLTIFCDKYGATLTVGDTQLIAWYKVDIKAGKQAKGDYAFDGFAYISGKDFLRLKPILLKRGWEFHSAKSGSPWFAEGETGKMPVTTPSSANSNTTSPNPKPQQMVNDRKDGEPLQKSSNGSDLVVISDKTDKEQILPVKELVQMNDSTISNETDKVESPISSCKKDEPDKSAINTMSNKVEPKTGCFMRLVKFIFAVSVLGLAIVGIVDEVNTGYCITSLKKSTQKSTQGTSIEQMKTLVQDFKKELYGAAELDESQLDDCVERLLSATDLEFTRLIKKLPEQAKRSLRDLRIKIKHLQGKTKSPIKANTMQAPQKSPKHGEVASLILPGGELIEMIYCAPSTFLMGSPLSEIERGKDETQHRVTLTKGFWLSKNKVSQSEWIDVMGGNPSEEKGFDLPVAGVSWLDCSNFVAKINAKIRCGARLPTEAEWEYACREAIAKRCSFVDMQCGLMEWCNDFYGGDYSVKSVKDPQGARTSDTTPCRVLRGGDEPICGGKENDYRSYSILKRDKSRPARRLCNIPSFRKIWKVRERYASSDYWLTERNYPQDSSTVSFPIGFRLCCDIIPDMDD